MHSPDGEKPSGANAASSLAPLVMQVVRFTKMGLAQNFAIDSQCFTYLVSALEHVCKPTGSLAGQKVALFRSFLYSGAWHFITPTADREWRRITDETKRRLHERWNSVHFGTVPFYLPEQESEAEDRANKFFQIHPKKNDCLILAEAEILGAKKLITYDQDFLKRLLSETTIKLVSPEEHWSSMQIAPGTKPKVVPHPGNPISNVTWWRV